MSGTDYANSSTGVVFENGLVGKMKQSVKINENKQTFEEKENQHEIVTEQIEIVSSKNMANELCTSKTKLPEDERICLIGSVACDEKIVLAARSFNVPVIISETGIELVKETQWTTYFVMNEFEGEFFNVIRKSKHRIYGPAALQQIAQSAKGLVYVNRPLYNFSMKGVVTCFTGIRKKDELTRLVNLIHTMGGSIRKDMKDNSRCTHLICSASVGEKYHYAKTFNLTVVRPTWIYAAWEQRNDPHFFANETAFCDSHKLKSFEGLRICFYGFSPEDHQEMVDILKANGGIPTDIEDPECTHLIFSNNISHFPEILNGPASPSIVPSVPVSSIIFPISEDKIQPPEGLDQLNLNDKIIHNKPSFNHENIVETPKKVFKSNNVHNNDDIIENHFMEPGNLSPILHNIEEEEENESQLNEDPNDKSKRKRDSFDNISIVSTDTFAVQSCSAKKPKLIRTGSITRSLRRSMSFAALKNPISNMIRVRRNSIDPNTSINSVTSIESTFSESRRPVKDKLMSFKDRITNSSRSKRERDLCLTPQTPKKFNTPTVGAQTKSDNDKNASPNNLKCGRLINSTMNSTTIAETLEPECIEDASVIIDKKTSFQTLVENKQTIAADVADNSKATIIQSQSILLAAVDNQKNSVPHMVKSDWFWYTIQKGIASEDEHRFNDYIESMTNTPGGDRRDSLPLGMRQRKRRRGIPFLGASGKRRSSISDATLSVSSSFLDCSNSPSIKCDSKGNLTFNIYF